MTSLKIHAATGWALAAWLQLLACLEHVVHGRALASACVAAFVVFNVLMAVRAWTAWKSDPA